MEGGYSPLHCAWLSNKEREKRARDVAFTKRLLKRVHGSERYRITHDRVLGKGSYGSVYEAIDLDTKQKVAIKHVKGVFDQSRHCKMVLRELSILRQAGHTRIMKMVDVLMPRDLDNFNELFMVLEHAPADLNKIFGTRQYLTDRHIQWILYQLADALHYLHSARVVHRDLKPSNVLVDGKCNIKVGTVVSI